MKRLAAILFFLSVCAISSAQDTVQFEQLDSLQKIQKRPVVVLIGTNWCAYCQSMKQSFRKDRELKSMLGSKFYLVLLDAEDKRTIDYNNRKFKFKPTGYATGINELAIQLGTINGQVSYPSLCFLNSENEIIYQYAGFMNAADLKNLLKAIGTSRSI